MRGKTPLINQWGRQPRGRTPLINQWRRQLGEQAAIDSSIAAAGGTGSRLITSMSHNRSSHIGMLMAG